MAKASTPATWQCSTCKTTMKAETKPARTAGSKPCTNKLGHSWSVKAK